MKYAKPIRFSTNSWLLLQSERANVPKGSIGKVNDHIFEIVQMAYEESLTNENVRLSRTERKRLLSQILRLVLEDMIKKLDERPSSA